MENKSAIQRRKKQIAEMIPVKQWLSINECCSYLDISKSYFEKIAIDKCFTLSTIGSKKYYKLSELQSFLNENIVFSKPK